MRIALIAAMLVAWLAAATALTAGDGLIVTDEARPFPAGRYLDILEDPSGRLTIADVSAGETARRFTRSTVNVPYFAFTASAYWARLTIRSAARATDYYVIELAHPLMDYIDMYRPGPGSALKAHATGFRLPTTTRPIPHRHFVFPIKLAPGSELTVFFRAYGEERIELPITVWPAEAFYRKDRVEQFLFGIFYGILTIMALFTLLLYISVGDRLYLYYVFFVATYGLFQLYQNGFMAEYLWPDALVSWNHIITALIALTMIAILQFTQSFLEIKKHHRLAYRSLSAAKIYLALSIITPLFLSFAVCVHIQIVSAVIGLVLAIAVGVYAQVQGYRPAKFFLVAWTASLVGGIIYALKVLAVLPANFVTTYALQFGTVLQFILLALGMGDRINLMKQEKEHAQAEALMGHELATEMFKESAKLSEEHLAAMERKNVEIEALNRDLEKKVDDLNEANRRITLSEERYRLLIEGTNDIIFSLDERWNFTSINRAVLAHFKVKPEAVIGRNILELMYEGPGGNTTRQLVIEKLEEFARERRPISFRAEFISPIISEPREMQVRLEYLSIAGRVEVLGKASSVAEDVLLKYFEYEKQRYSIGNFLITSEEISHRITRNLYRYFDHREITLIRIALREIIINAIEHGNLEISFEDKTAAMQEERYFDLVAERQRHPRFSSRRVHIEYAIDPEKIAYKITDEGPGFDYHAVLNTDPDAVNENMLSHGRGITMAREVFDSIEYNKKGNQVLLVKNAFTAALEDERIEF